MNNQVSCPQIRVFESTIDLRDPWSDDRLNRKFFADHLTQIVNGQTNPCVITINGEWGSGKTFMLQRWQCDLEKGGYASLYFNAWEADSINHAALALIGELYRFFRERESNMFKEQVHSLGESCSKLFRFENISRIIAKKVEDNSGINITSPTSHCLDTYLEAGEQRKTLHKTIAEVSSMVFAECGKPFVFIVDELDRCRPLFALETLETIKHIFNVPHCIFVLGIDRDQLQKSIQAVYGEIDALKYLERFFDFDMRLSCPKVQTYFNYLYNAHIPNGETDSHYLTPDHESGKFRTALLNICEYFNLNLREIEIVFKTFFAIFKFQEIQHCNYPILLAIMIVIRLKKPQKYIEFVQSACNPKEIIDLPYVPDDSVNECSGLVMATVYGSYRGDQKQSQFENDIKELLESNLWDIHNPRNEGSVPERIIPRFVLEALIYREKIMKRNQPLQHDFNPALYFIKPFTHYETPTMRDKLELAKFIDMIE